MDCGLRIFHYSHLFVSRLYQLLQLLICLVFCCFQSNIAQANLSYDNGGDSGSLN